MRPNGIECLDCGEHYGEHIFLWIDDKTWEKIGCKPTDFLCAHCIIDRLGEIGTYAYLIPEVGRHVIKGANIEIKATRNFKEENV